MLTWNCDLNSYSCFVIVEVKRWFEGFSFIVVTGQSDLMVKFPRNASLFL